MTKQKKPVYSREFIKDAILILLAVVAVAALLIRLAELCIFDIYGIADKEAYRTISVTESTELRGSIYDANGITLAYSTPAFNLILSPYDIFEYGDIADEQEIIDDAKSSAKAREEAEEEIEEITAKAEVKARQICYMLSGLFPDDIESEDELYDTIKSLAEEKNSKYYCVLRQIDDKDKAKITNFVSSYNAKVTSDTEKAQAADPDAAATAYKIYTSSDLYFESNEKRVYPYGAETGVLLGYISKYGEAQNGLEQYYDSSLSGVADRRVSERGVSSIITTVFNKTFKGQDSVSLNTTIDINIQKILVDAIEEAQTNTHAEAVYGTVINTKTGAVLAMANTPGYDSNDPYTPLDSEVTYYTYLKENNILTTAEKQAKANGTEEETTEEATTAAADEETTAAENGETAAENETAETEEKEETEKETVPQGTLIERTKNKAVIDYFYPGSIYKAFLVAGALEEGMTINYNCLGVYTIPDSDTGSGENREITCALNASHGYNLDAKLLLENSCNICAAQLGLDMGSDMFFKYYETFGFTEATGIDTYGGNTDPGTALYYTEYDNTSLATCAFGQNNKVSNIQLAVAMSALGNGGYIMKPYIVESTVDDDGNIISKTEPTVKRQAVSGKTASLLKEYLKGVVEEGGGTRARLDNYYVSGKTGTSQIKDSSENTIGYVASFAGFAPTTDPEITVVIDIVDPKNETGSYSEILASQIAAPVAGTVFEQTLEYLGIPYDKTAE